MLEANATESLELSVKGSSRGPQPRVAQTKKARQRKIGKVFFFIVDFYWFKANDKSSFDGPMLHLGRAECRSLPNS